MKHFPSRHVVFFSLFGFATVLGSAVAATPAADIAALRAKAEQGNPIAQYNLGLACADLHESFYDPVEAYVWLNLAATGGTTGKALSAIIDTMTPAQLAEGQRRVAARRTNHVAVATSPIAVPSVASEKPAADTVADVSKEADALKVSLNAQLADANKRLAIAQAALASKDKTIASLQGQLIAVPASAPALSATEFASVQQQLAQTADALASARRSQSLAEAEAASLKATADRVGAPPSLRIPWRKPPGSAPIWMPPNYPTPLSPSFAKNSPPPPKPLPTPRLSATPWLTSWPTPRLFPPCRRTSPLLSSLPL